MAAAVVAEPDLLALPWAQIALAGLIAMGGGLTRTAQTAVAVARAAQDAIDAGGAPKPVPALWPELLKDALVSIGIGGLTYLIGAWQGWPLYLLPVAIYLLGYAGARVLDTAAEAAYASLRRRIRASGQ